MAIMEDVALYIHGEILKNAQSNVAKAIKKNNESILGVYDSMMKWKSMVGNRRPWDHKRHIKATYGEWTYDTTSRKHYNFDIWSNLHYGYVGRAVDFSTWTLKAGAGAAQFKAGTSPEGYWGRRVKTLGDADFLAAFDDPKDQAAIAVGAALWENHKLAVTATNVVEAVRAARSHLQVK